MSPRKMSPEELARRFAEANRMVVLLRRATLDMQIVREHVLSERGRWATIRSRGGR